MAVWVEPKFSKSKVDKAAQVLQAGPYAVADPDDFWNALDKVDNWRAAHQYPMFATRVTLEQRARRIDSRANVVQRLKRLSSIQYKLKRFPNMNLSQLNDIGGCRAIVDSIASVEKLRQRYDDGTRRVYDYIASPKPDGYRGIHVVLNHIGTGPKAVFSGLRVEIQIRTKIQHAWATAVEVVDTLTGQNLKLGLGDDRWRRFMLLAAGVLARQEGCPLPAGIPAYPALLQELNRLEYQLNALFSLQRFAASFSIMPQGPRKRKFKPTAFVLRLDPPSLVIRSFALESDAEAARALFEEEKAVAGSQNVQVVLVRASSVQALKRGFPNYFFDTRKFAREISAALASLRAQPIPPPTRPIKS
jgi:hypothetical protein